MTHLTDHFDVIVVGAGPAGSSCATTLAAGGKRVLIIDKASFPRDKICGECIHPGCWTFFELLGVADDLRTLGRRVVECVSITNTSGRQVFVDFAQIKSQPIVAMKRALLDAMLLDRAKSAGARALDHTSLTAIRWMGKWIIRIRSNGGLTGEVSSHALVAADGRNSFVAERFSQRSGFGRNPKRVAIQWHAPFQPWAANALEMFLFSSGYTGVVNVDAATANIAMVTTPETAALASRDFPAFLEATLFSNARAASRLRNDPMPKSFSTAYPINPVTSKSLHPAMYLVGDAHQTVEPFTGEGILFALQDGISAANRILTGTSARRKVPFWSNDIFSPIVQRPSLAQSLVAAASRVPKVVPWGFRTIFG